MDHKVSNLLIGGDVCPIGKVGEYFVRSDVKGIFNDLLEEFHQADFSIVNLECPLVDESFPIVKAGPNLRAPSKSIEGLKQAGVDAVNLANNHIMDHGPHGLRSTLRVCRNVGLKTVGAGQDLKEARKMLIEQVNNIKVGIMGVAEYEFSLATKTSPGANPLDVVDFVRNVRDNRQSVDYLIVLVHGGNQHYPYPSPRMKDTCHFMVEMGANAVIMQHTHCPGCYESYQNAHIVYGQGNLIFDVPNRHSAFYEGFLVRLSVSEDLTSTLDIVPYWQCLNKSGARKMDPRNEELFRKLINERSIAVQEDSFVQNQWLNFCHERKSEYLDRLLSHNRFLRKLNRLKLFLKHFYSKHSLTRLQNTILCEAHREAAEIVLAEFLSD